MVPFIDNFDDVLTFFCEQDSSLSSEQCESFDSIGFNNRVKNDNKIIILFIIKLLE